MASIGAAFAANQDVITAIEQAVEISASLMGSEASKLFSRKLTPVARMLKTAETARLFSSTTLGRLSETRWLESEQAQHISLQRLGHYVKFGEWLPQRSPVVFVPALPTPARPATRITS